MPAEGPSVYILTQYFYPEVPATAQLDTDLALGLVDAGFRVSVFTGQPAYRGAQRLPSVESYRGIQIHRAYSRTLSREGTSSRLLNGATVAGITLLRLLGRPKPDVVLVDTTSPFLQVVAWLVRLVRRIPYVVLVQDIYPDIAVQLGVIGPRSIAARVWRFAYRRVYRASARIIVLGERMRDRVGATTGPARHGKFEVIPNWADGDQIVPRRRDDNPMRQGLGLADKLVVLYSGNMGLIHDMETVIEAAERLRSLSDVRFLFIGAGGKRAWVEEQVQSRGMSNVTMLPYQPLEALPYSLTCGDMSLVTLRRGMEGLSLPSKVYSSLAAGLPILGVCGANSEVADLVEKHRCGFRVAQGDVDGLVAAIQALYDDPNRLADMRRRARAAFEAHFTRAQSIGRYATVLREVAGQKRSGGGVRRDAA